MANEIHAIGMDEKSAGLMEPNGTIKIVGFGKGGYFYHVAAKPEVCAAGKPLTFKNIAVEKVTTGQTFDLEKWKGEGSRYTLSVDNGELTTTTAGGSSY